jgi:hypothetical protein
VRFVPVLFFSLLFSSCLVRTRVIAPAGKPAHKPLLTATKEQLIQRVHAIFDPIRSFTMKVDLSPSLGSVYAGKITDYPTIGSYIFFRAPDQIRVVGLDPVVHGTAFDMLSTGNDFVVSIPSRNEFIRGANDAPANSQNKLENLRPAAFLSALLIRPPVAPGDLAVLEDDTSETRAEYVLLMLRRNGEELHLVRNIYFDRYTLQITRQTTFDASGSIQGDTKYSNWKTFDGVSFPSGIDMQRPFDGYELELTVTNVKLNSPELTADKFAVAQPPNAQVRVLK